MASYGGELLLDSSSPWSGISSLSSFSIPLPFIFQEAKESIDKEDPRPSSSNEDYINLGDWNFSNLIKLPSTRNMVNKVSHFEIKVIAIAASWYHIIIIDSF